MGTKLYFEGLKDTLEKGNELIFSQYSNLVLYLDTTIDLQTDDDMSLIIKNQAFENSEIIYYNDISIGSSTDSIIIPMGSVMHLYENGSIGGYMGFYLESDGASFNSSQIQFNFNQNNGRKPRLNLTYRR